MFLMVQELLRYFRLHFTNPVHIEKKRFLKEEQKGVIISFTTTPERISRIKPMLNSILDQDVGILKVWLNLSRDRFQDHPVPEYLNSIKCLKINWIDSDLGPASKLLPTLKGIKDNSLIIVLDDDQVYPKELVSSYLDFARKSDKVAMGLQGWKVPLSMKHEDKQTVLSAAVRVFDFGRKLREPVEIDILQGSSSYAVWPEFFNEDLFNYEDTPKSAFYADDIWMSGNLAKNGVRKYVIPSKIKYARLSVFFISRKYKLIHTHNRDHSNNNEMYQYFKGYWNQ